MSKTVLLIESDSTFARDMSAALESRGFGVRSSPDGKEGVELARALHPDCVVLCVELPGLSGYSWCNRLKKDDALKRIPLVITSSEATPETFEQHRKLKTRAEDYLIKPFSPATLVERVGALVGMPEAPVAGDEELITLADVELDGPAEGGVTAVEEDADLQMLDDAFDNISGGGGDEPSTRAPGAPVAEPPLTLLPDADESPAVMDLDREMAEALASLAEEAAAPARVASLANSPPAAPVRLVHPTVEPVSGADETPILLEDVEVLPTVDVTDQSTAVALSASKEEARVLREEVDRLRAAAAGREGEASARDAELDSIRSRLQSSESQAATLRADLEGARDSSRMAEQRSSDLERELGALRPRLEEAERSASARGTEVIQAVGRAESLQRALEEARSEFTGNRAKADALRTEADALRTEADSLRAQAETVRMKLESLQAEGATLRSELETARTEGEGLRSELGSVRAAGDALRSEVEALRAERDSLRAEAAAFRTEAEARADGLTRRLQETEAQVAQHEDRVLRAYQKIKSDEKLREKTRKALAMVIQVLEDRSAPDGSTPPATPER